MFRAAPPILAVLLAIGQSGPVRADEPGAPLARGWSIGITGGVQKWSMKGLEEALEVRHAAFGAQGYSFPAANFDWTPAFGGEISYRFASGWLVRFQGEWSRHSWSAGYPNERQPVVGAPVSERVWIGTTTRVETNFVMTSLGVGRVHVFESVGLGWAVGGVVAPLEVTDRVENTVEAEDTVAPNDVTASGVGLGAEGILSVDYPVQSSSTVYLEGVYRIGATEVELDDPAWDGTFTPRFRKVDFTGFGVRLGLRWS